MADTQPVSVGEDAPVFEVMATMRAMRRLKPDPVPDDILERLVQAATWGPSGSNNQSYEFVVVTDRDVMQRLAVLWKRSVDAYLPSIGSVTPAASDPAVRKALLYQCEHFAETPAVIVACYRSEKLDLGVAKKLLTGLPPLSAARFTAQTPRMTALVEGSSVYPGVQNLLLAARALGLGAVLTVWHLFLEHEWKQELGIPRGVGTYAVVPVGWPKGKLGSVQRRPAAEVIHKNRW